MNHIVLIQEISADRVVVRNVPEGEMRLRTDRRTASFVTARFLDPGKEFRSHRLNLSLMTSHVYLISHTL